MCSNLIWLRNDVASSQEVFVESLFFFNGMPFVSLDVSRINRALNSLFIINVDYLGFMKTIKLKIVLKWIDL